MATNSPPRNFSNATRVLVEAVGNADTEPYLAKVTQRIQELKDELLALRFCHNAVMPACRLPPEILVNVFSMISEPAMRTSEWYFPPSAPLSWIFVTHVCRRWRSAALDWPNLWTNLQFVSPPFAELMLDRSRDAPLTVRVANPDRKHVFEPVLSRALSQLNRLRIIEISHSHLNRSTVMPGLAAISQWKGSASALQTLILRNMAGGPQSKIQLDNDAPALQVLHIARCGIDWEDAPLGCQLTDLTLQEDGRPGTRRPSVEQFQASLANMRFLQKLDLDGFGPLVPPAIQPLFASPVSMPSLTNLIVADTTMHVSLVFRLLHLPDPQSVIVYFHDTSNVAGLSQAVGHIKQALENISKGVHSLELYVCSEDQRYIDLRFHPVEDSRRMLFQFPDEYVRPPADSIFDMLDTHMDLSTVITVEAELGPSDIDWSEELWAKLSRLPRLKEANVYMTAEEAAEFFTWWSREALRASNSRPCFPALSKITFENQYDYDGEPRLAHAASMLVEILKTRSSPLLELNIKGFGPLSFAERASMQRVAPGLKIMCGQEG